MKKIIFGLLIFFTFSISNCHSKSSDIALKDYFYKLQTDTTNIDNYLDSLIIAYPQDFRFSYQKAISLIQSDNLEKATAILDSLVQTGIKNELLYQLLINCYVQDNKIKQAFRVTDSALFHFPTSYRILLESAYLQMELNNSAMAVSQLENALQINPYCHECYYPLIDYYFKNGSYLNWAILYSEVFINLSTNEKLSFEISQNLLDMILNALPHDSIKTSTFTNIIYYYIPGQIDSTNYSFPIVYDIMMTHAYNALNSQGKTLERSINYVCSLLTEFNYAWYNSIYSNKWNNPIFAYHKLLIENKLFEPYCYLILKASNSTEFDSYFSKNPKLFKRLLEFMEHNRITLNQPFHSTMLKY